MVPEQTIHDLHELHEERIDLAIRYKNLQHKHAAIDRKEGWLIASWLVGIPLGIAFISPSRPFFDRPIEQQIFWIVAVLGAMVWSAISWRHLRKEGLENMQQRQEVDRKLDHLENRLRSFNPPPKNLRQSHWWWW